MNLTALAAAHPDRVAYLLHESGERLSYAELERRSNQVAHLFRRLGLRPGDHIAFLSENRLEVFPVVWAAQRAGLLYTPVNWHLGVEEATYIVDNCQAKVLLHSADLAELASTCDSLPHLRKRVVIAGTAPGAEALADLIADLPTTPIEDEVEGATMMYSSGTTGRPKGILPVLPGTPFGTGLILDRTVPAFGVGPGSVYLSPAPVHHAAPLGWCLAVVRNGGTVVVMRKFEPEAALDAVQTHGVTHGQFVPTMFVRMLKLPDEVRRSYDVSSLQVVVHAAAPCPVEVKRRMIEWLGPCLVEYYAGSEATGMTMIDSQQWLTHPGSVGPAVIGTLHVTDETGRELPSGEVGTIWFADGPTFEYYRDPAKTADAVNERGWSTLGDLGHLDDDGFLYLSDRRDDLIISGGVNIYPREIEDALALHPRVADVAVVGLADQEFGQSVHALVQPAAGTSTADLQVELNDFLRSRIAHFKVPRSWEFGEVPRTPTGKLLRRAVLARRV